MKKWVFKIFVLLCFKASAQDTIKSLPADTLATINYLSKPEQAVISSDPGKRVVHLYQAFNDIAAPPQRRHGIALAAAATIVGYGGSFILLNRAWYKDYPRSSFHTFNDAGEWKQMDKIGHAWTSYTLSRVSSNMWYWAGLKKKSSVLIGSGSGLLYLLSIEYLDGRSSEWGWSWADVGTDLFGTGLYAAQELGWKEQRIQLKFSAHKKIYQPASLQQRANDLFGKSLPERLLKDYNEQTYWLSFNINSLLQEKKFPAWLNIAIGHGAEGMFGGYENLAYDKDGNISFDRRDIKRYRQWYLAPDIDLAKIKTNSRFLHSVFSAINILKIPAPALEFSNGKLRVKGMVF